MQFLYDHVKPEQMVEDIKDKKLRTLCEEILKWNSEMNEYWVDDEKRCINNVIWGMKLATKCRARSRCSRSLSSRCVRGVAVAVSAIRGTSGQSSARAPSRR